MFEALAEAIDELEIPPFGDAIAEVAALHDRLGAALCSAVGDFDPGGGWEIEGATSMTAWLRQRARLSGRDAARVSSTARRLRKLPAVSSAFAEGALSSGQVAAIVANLTDDTTPMFVEQEAELLLSLTPLGVRDLARAIQAWRQRAEALLPDDDPPPERRRSLHHSQTLDGHWVTDGDFDPEGGSVIDTARRLPESPDVEGEPARKPSERRGDAIVGICRWFLDHQQTNAGVHRVLTAGRADVLDYGRTTRTIPASLWAALVVRDRHCRFPGCDRGPGWCEGHHVTPWEHDGPTSLENLALMCTRHHHLLHTEDWEGKLLPSAEVHVATPDGRVLVSQLPP